MIAAAIKRALCNDLKFCETKRDILRAFTAAQKGFTQRNVPIYRRQEVLKELRATLEECWDGPVREELLAEAKFSIDALLLANS